MPKIICFTGAAGTGKTTVARQIAKELGYEYLSTADIFREHAKAKGFTSVGEFMEQVGRKKSYEIVRPLALQKIKQLGRQGLVFDGLYDPLLLREIIKKFQRKNITIVNLTAAKAMRRHFFGKRYNFPSGKAKAMLRLRHAYKWAGGMQAVKAKADITMRSTGKLETAVQRLRSRLKHFK